MIMPKRLITLMVMPKKLASTNMPAKATGMLSATQNARRMFRNMARKAPPAGSPAPVGGQHVDALPQRDRGVV